MGLPIVATRCGVEEVIEDTVTGRLVDTNDPGALAAAVKSLLEDAGTGKTLGDNARRVARQQYDVDEMRRSYTNLYARLLKHSDRT